MTRRVLPAAVIAGILALPAAPAPAAPLNGTLRLDPGRSTSVGVTGSNFRLRFPGAGRRYFRNSDSPARDKTFTLLRGGTAGGLALGRYQGAPGATFDRRGNARAREIIRPTPFAGIRFSLVTQSVDPQSRRRTPRPTADLSGRRLTVDLSALTATWNGQPFNQGAPKPGGSGRAVGSYDPRTRRFFLRWNSRVDRGPFNGFIGEWVLTGTVQRR